MDSKLSRWCEGFLEAGWLAAVVATPLFFNIHSARVFEPDKLTLLRSIALLMAVAWLVRLVDRQGWRDWGWLRPQGERSIWRLPFVLPIALLVLVYLVSSLFSVTPRVSWAGSYQRLQGTYTTLSYVVVFALMASAIRTRAQVERVVTAVIITSIPVSLYGMLQHFGLDPLPWGGDVQRRIAGHMGNAIFIAAYLIMAVPLTLARIIDAFTNILGDAEMSYADVIRSSIYIFTFFIQLLAIYWSGSRGPWLGLAVGLFAFALILLVALRNTDAERRAMRPAEGLQAFAIMAVVVLLPLFAAAYALGEASPVTSLVVFAAGTAVVAAAILVVDAVRRGWRWVWLDFLSWSLLMGLLLVAFNLPAETVARYQDAPVVGPVVETLEEWRQIPGIGRLGRLLEDDRETGKVRVLIWQGVLELIRPHEPLEFPDGRADSLNLLRPIIGYGPEAMYVAYNRFYPPELATVEARNASPDRSHNETFDALVITGAAGFLVWQALYLSVFYYAFRWLGVVRHRRDSALLIGLWVAGAVVVGLIFALWRGPVYLGVAIPFGSILGLVLYLSLYALLARPDEAAAQVRPFDLDRLLLMALVGAVAAHYVEIHFGIAIAATRLHFFVYVALLLLVGHALPRLKELAAAPVAVESPMTRKKRRMRPAPAGPAGWWSPALAFALLMTLVVGILAFEYMNFAPPPGLSIQTVDDVPQAGAIFRQAMLVHPGKGFVDSPFIYLLIVLTWALGLLIGLSEMVKQGVVSFSVAAGRIAAGRQRGAAATLGALAAGGLILYVLTRGEGASTSRLVGAVLFWLWTVASGGAAALLFAGHPRGRRIAGIAATAGLLTALPLLLIGGAAALFGLLIGLGAALALYLLWDPTWSAALGPALVIGLTSALVGLSFGYFQAFLLRGAIIGVGVQAGMSDVQRRVLETGQQTTYLTIFYFFVIGLVILLAAALAAPTAGRIRDYGRTAGWLALSGLLLLGFYAIYSSNLRIIHADIVYKRGNPYDEQAMRTRDPALWDYSIAIYQRALELAPLEDFYYLWLGRAFLEKSSATTDPLAQETLLETAREQLLRAQEINPLNTDHTANLARLHTRWSELTAGEERTARSNTAIAFYQDALRLSPQNAVIWNEYARLAFILQGDCERSIELFQRSAEVDTYFPTTHFELADIYRACADRAEGETRQRYQDGAVASLEAGLVRQPNDPVRWVRLAQFQQQLGDLAAALAAYRQARERANAQVTAWQLDYAMAEVYLQIGDTAQARVLAQQALAAAPPEQSQEIQSFISSLAAGGATVP